MFAGTRAFRDHLLSLGERNTSLVGLAFWLGFSRAEVGYDRRPRRHGKSGWSFARRVRYLLDSAFAFSDLPIRLMSLTGAVGMILSIVFALIVVYARLRGDIPVPGYAATVLTVMFFGGSTPWG